MNDLIVLRRAPRNAIAPPRIEVSDLFKLDIADELWQDIGLNFDEVDVVPRAPPPWLADEKVRQGIRAMLELDRCDEEEERLAVERKAMQSWLKEEWNVVRYTIDKTGMQYFLYYLDGLPTDCIE
ncbi:hypothetical protein K435DRAFT_700925 [Dendrothele bispora CBS 962.96]|uniref:Uncharacterized protein n=2 Tax=Dendrothele bispora (strain CBS 962.96) TaxID=1314807 RepID=A0A4S8KQP0_DENBC|nr:hypothetical protein K435DRAFT_700925 [Dendrothele bispora CBS 962.96]